MNTEAFDRQREALGEASGEYQAKVLIPWLVLLGWSLLGVTSVAVFAFDMRNEWYFIFFAALFFTLAVMRLRQTLRNRGSRVLLFEHGMMVVRPGTADITRWDDVEYIVQSVVRRTTGTDRTYTIHKKGGGQLTIDDGIGGSEEVGKRMQEEVTSRIFPVYAAALAQGQTLSFGKLSLSREGIASGDSMLPWREVEGLIVDNGYLAVRRQGKLFRWSGQRANGTPNVFVLVELVNRVVASIRSQK